MSNEQEIPPNETMTLHNELLNSGSYIPATAGKFTRRQAAFKKQTFYCFFPPPS